VGADAQRAVLHVALEVEHGVLTRRHAAQLGCEEQRAHYCEELKPHAGLHQIFNFLCFLFVHRVLIWYSGFEDVEASSTTGLNVSLTFDAKRIRRIKSKPRPDVNNRVENDSQLSSG